MKGFYRKKIIRIGNEIRNVGFCPFCADEFEEKDCSKCNKPLNDNVMPVFPFISSSLFLKIISLLIWIVIVLQKPERVIISQSL